MADLVVVDPGPVRALTQGLRSRRRGMVLLTLGRAASVRLRADPAARHVAAWGRAHRRRATTKVRLDGRTNWPHPALVTVLT
jgi:hypothetical protein